MLTDKQLEEFQLLYKKHFGEELSKQDALEKAISLINLVKIVYGKEVTKQRYSKFKKYYEERILHGKRTGRKTATKHNDNLSLHKRQEIESL
ncbi:MAG: hypothetical protein PHS54_03465 [Clostridia bacterium]|nr:hypothetical protein [Clostridia bacterium]